MLSNSAISQCSLQRRGDSAYFLTPNDEFNCELTIPEAFQESFKNRMLTESETMVIQYLRDVEGYDDLDAPFAHCDGLSVGKFIALLVARFSNCRAVNIEHDHRQPVEYPWSQPSNPLESLHIGQRVDLLTEHGLLTAMVIGYPVTKDDCEEDLVRLFVLSDVYYPIAGSDKMIRQLSKIDVLRSSLIGHQQFLYN